MTVGIDHGTGWPNRSMAGEGHCMPLSLLGHGVPCPHVRRNPNDPLYVLPHHDKRIRSNLRKSGIGDEHTPEVLQELLGRQLTVMLKIYQRDAREFVIP